MPRRSSGPRPRNVSACPLMTPRSDARVSLLNSAKTWSSSTAAAVWSGPMRPPSSMSSPSSGPSWRSMKRFAIPDSEVGLIVACVPWRSGA